MIRIWMWTNPDGSLPLIRSVKIVRKIEIIWKKTKIPSLCPVGEQWYKKCSCHDRKSASRWSSRHKSNTCFCGDQEWHKSNPIREDIPKFDCCQEGFSIHRLNKISIWLTDGYEFENLSQEIIHTRKDVNTGLKKDFTLKMVNRTHYQTVDEDGKSGVGVCVGENNFKLR